MERGTIRKTKIFPSLHPFFSCFLFGFTVYIGKLFRFYIYLFFFSYILFLFFYYYFFRLLFLLLSNFCPSFFTAFLSFILITSPSYSHYFRIILASFSHHSRIILASFSHHSRIISSSFPIIFPFSDHFPSFSAPIPIVSIP